MAPNGYDDDFCGRAAGFDHGVQHFIDAGAFECHVHAFAVGQFFTSSTTSTSGRVEDVVGNAGFAGFVFARFAQFGDDDFDAFGFQHGGKQQTDGACAADQCDVACFRTAADVGVMVDGQGSIKAAWSNGILSESDVPSGV